MSDIDMALDLIGRGAEEIIKRANPTAKIEFLPYRDAYGDDFEDVRRRVPDVSRLEKTLGKKPLMTLGDILDDIIRWKREQLAKSKA